MPRPSRATPPPARPNDLSHDSVGHGDIDTLAVHRATDVVDDDRCTPAGEVKVEMIEGPKLFPTAAQRASVDRIAIRGVVAALQPARRHRRPIGSSPNRHPTWSLPRATTGVAANAPHTRRSKQWSISSPTAGVRSSLRARPPSKLPSAHPPAVRFAPLLHRIRRHLPKWIEIVTLHPKSKPSARGWNGVPGTRDVGSERREEITIFEARESACEHRRTKTVLCLSLG